MEFIFLVLYAAFSSLVYSVALDQKLGFNPYPFGATILCILFHPLVLISSIFYLGWVWGTICFLLHLLGITYSTVGWIFNLPTLLVKNDEQLLRFLKVKLTLLFPSLIIGIIFTVISFFFSDYKALLDIFMENSTFTITLIAIVIILSVLRIFVSKLSSNVDPVQNSIGRER